MKGLAAALVAVVLTTTLAACSNDGIKDVDGSPAPETLTVFAAASLKGSFTRIGAAFEKQNPEVTVRFSFAGSSDLLAQLQQGAPADVFASADEATMDTARVAGVLDGDARDFASNTLEIATPPDNPAGIRTLADLASPDVKVVVCAPTVPCGAATEAVEKESGVDIEPVSEEQSVTDVLGKILSGEADAGLVYVTDVKAAGKKVQGVPFGESSEVVNTYPIATVRRSDHAGTAEAFTDFVTGPEGQAILAAAGFGAP
ncbi:molybdate ABC transporter substrate-binding protein [Aeromicrobium wangtongii]|uniref:molybdate ABC transporter substrate-binding protein n=1 Tax=Aeromicrobium wangtongii TaxID=2969247 RepID=UPI00384F293E